MSRNDERDQARARRLQRRYRAERRFRYCGIMALSVGVVSLAFLLGSIFSKGLSGFLKTEIQLDVFFDAELLGLSKEVSAEDIAEADYYTLLRSSLYARFPTVTERQQKRELGRLLSSGADLELRAFLSDNPDALNTVQSITLTASSEVDQIHKGNAPKDIDASQRLLSDFQLAMYEKLRREGRVSLILNTDFFTRGDSRSPELAGIGGALIGSLLTLTICLALSFPIGVATAVYLEEFAPKNRLTELIEINLNNLAAVPSIIFGLLGLGVFISLFGIPRGSSLVGGMVLSLMTLPTIIIASRASLKAVPPSIREAALGMGASRVQVVLHHVLPLALPGTLTGTIIGLGQALGQTAPLIMIGMVAFVVDIPQGATDSATVLPVQIYLWAESAERGFVEKTSAAIMVILGFLVMMNLTAVYLRQKFERQW